MTVCDVCRDPEARVLVFWGEIHTNPDFSLTGEFHGELCRACYEGLLTYMKLKAKQEAADGRPG